MLTDDLDTYFNASEHAVAATYDGATAVNVILDLAYVAAMDIAGARTVAWAKASDFPAACVGKTLAVGATSYVIRGRELQDDGAIVLLPLSG